jgi:hypothetical protein
MSALIRAAFLITFVAALGGKVLAEAAADDLEATFDPEEYGECT